MFLRGKEVEWEGDAETHYEECQGAFMCEEAGISNSEKQILQGFSAAAFETITYIPQFFLLCGHENVQKNKPLTVMMPSICMPVSKCISSHS